MSNINNWKKVALDGAKLVSGDHLAIHTEIQRALGYALPPSWSDSTDFTLESAANADPSKRHFKESDPSCLPAVRSALALTGLDHLIHMANADARLSPAGRVEKLAEPRRAAIKMIATAGGDVAAIGRDVQAREGEFYAPAKVPAGDVAAAFEDRELRDSWRASPTPKRMQMLEQMARGENPRMLESLVRSPIPLEAHEAGLVTSAWRGAVDARMPKEAAELKSSRANVDWADSVVRASAQYARRSSGLSSLEIEQAAQGTGGEHLFNYANTAPIAAIAAA